MAAPATSGLPCATQARFTACRVAKLSQQSITTSAASTRRNSSASSARAACVSMDMPGLMSRMACAADSTFRLPTRAWVWATWRWRLVRSTSSSSTSVTCPTPAAARYSATGEPRPPAPMTSARPALTRAWPSMPNSSSRIWRE
jgi:hypothetical protein